MSLTIAGNEIVDFVALDKVDNRLSGSVRPEYSTLGQNGLHVETVRNAVNQKMANMAWTGWREGLLSNVYSSVCEPHGNSNTHQPRKNNIPADLEILLNNVPNPHSKTFHVNVAKHGFHRVDSDENTNGFVARRSDLLEVVEGDGPDGSESLGGALAGHAGGGDGDDDDVGFLELGLFVAGWAVLWFVGGLSFTTWRSQSGGKVSPESCMRSFILHHRSSPAQEDIWSFRLTSFAR